MDHGAPGGDTSTEASPADVSGAASSSSSDDTHGADGVACPDPDTVMDAGDYGEGIHDAVTFMARPCLPLQPIYLADSASSFSKYISVTEGSRRSMSIPLADEADEEFAVLSEYSSAGTDSSSCNDFWEDYSAELSLAIIPRLGRRQASRNSFEVDDLLDQHKEGVEEEFEAGSNSGRVLCKSLSTSPGFPLDGQLTSTPRGVSAVSGSQTLRGENRRANARARAQGFAAAAAAATKTVGQGKARDDIAKAPIARADSLAAADAPPAVPPRPLGPRDFLTPKKVAHSVSYGSNTTSAATHSPDAGGGRHYHSPVAGPAGWSPAGCLPVAMGSQRQGSFNCKLRATRGHSPDSAAQGVLCAPSPAAIAAKFRSDDCLDNTATTWARSAGNNSSATRTSWSRSSLSGKSSASSMTGEVVDCTGDDSTPPLPLRPNDDRDGKDGEDDNDGSHNRTASFRFATSATSEGSKAPTSGRSQSLREASGGDKSERKSRRGFGVFDVVKKGVGRVWDKVKADHPQPLPVDNSLSKDARKARQRQQELEQRSDWTNSMAEHHQQAQVLLMEDVRVWH